MNRTAEIEEEFAKDKAERKRKYHEWRQKVNGVLEKLEAIIVEVIRDAPASSRTRRLARCELKALQRLREGEANEAVREEAHMEEATKRMRMAADSARAAGVEWMTALQDQADFAAGSAGGRLPPQEGVEATEEAAGGEARAAAGYAPWESAEEREQDIAHMGRISFLSNRYIYWFDLEET